MGALDLLDLVENSASELKDILDWIGGETSALGTKIGERTEELTAANRGGALSRREYKSLIGKAAIDMNQFALRVKAEMPRLREVMEKSMDVVARFALMTTDPTTADRKQVTETRDALAMLLTKIDYSCNQTSLFQKTVTGLPRLTTELNKAKRETANVLSEMETTLAAGRREISQTIEALDVFLKADPPNS